MTAHTPGPWTAALSGEHRGSIFAGVDGEEEKIGGFYADEDAILAAAAPEMFEALTNLVKLLDLRDPWDEGAVAAWNAASDKSRAALSKARPAISGGAE